jgi:nucleotide-binding universal stress UspA family protein
LVFQQARCQHDCATASARDVQKLRAGALPTQVLRDGTALTVLTHRGPVLARAVCFDRSAIMTTSFNHILVPTDYSEPAVHARELATTLARRFHSRITLLNVYYVPPMPFGNPFQWPMGDLARLARDEMDKELAAAKEAHPDVRAIVRAGSPAETILSAADELHADLIVLGTHGRHGISRLLGSVAANVVRLAKVPVLTTSGARI